MLMFPPTEFFMILCDLFHFITFVLWLNYNQFKFHLFAKIITGYFSTQFYSFFCKIQFYYWKYDSIDTIEGWKDCNGRSIVFSTSGDIIPHDTNLRTSIIHTICLALSLIFPPLHKTNVLVLDTVPIIVTWEPNEISSK